MAMTCNSPLPSEPADLLCIGCGYLLRGLPEEGECPECGRPIAQSLDSYRRLTPFETAPSFRSFCRTSFAAIFHPVRFSTSLSFRPGGKPAAWFGGIHRGLAAVLLAVFFSAQVCLPNNTWKEPIKNII